MDKPVIDLGHILNVIKKRKRLFYITTLIAIIFGVIVAFSMPLGFTSTVKLAPESGRSGLGGELNSLASLVGVNLGSGNKTNDAFYPIMYPDICASNDFVIPLWNMHVSTADHSLTTTLYDYLAHHQKSTWWFKGLYWLTHLFSKEDEAEQGGPSSDPSTNVDPFHLNKEQDHVAGAIKNMIKCAIDKKTDVISITVTAQDPLVAATVADSVQHALQAFITDYRTTKARQDLEYMEKLFDEARTEYEQARLRYTSYADSNNELILESYKAKQDDLENDMQLRYNIYSQMAQRLELAKAKVQEETPAFSVIQSATVPLKKSKPKRMTIVLGLMFLTFAGSVLWAMNHEPKKKEKVQQQPTSEKAEISEYSEKSKESEFSEKSEVSEADSQPTAGE